jgi:hypothetical protein
MHHEGGDNGPFALGSCVRTRYSRPERSTAFTAFRARTSTPISRNFSMNQPTSSASKFGSARARGNVRELGRDVPAADHQNAVGQMLKLHEHVARDGVLCVGEVERDRARAACNQPLRGRPSTATVSESVKRAMP